MRFLAFLLLFGCVGYGFAQPSNFADPNVSLEVSIASDNREFHIGETIPLRLAYSGAFRDRYEINRAQYDRSGRMEYEHFNLLPAEGVVDPLKNRLGGVGGGLTSFSFLTPQPWTIVLNLNEWVRFLRPGEYRLVVTSHRVSVKDSSSPLGAVPITVESNEVTLRIIPATKVWQEETLRSAVTTLDKPAPTKPQDRETHVKARQGALETVRFLGTADAVKELAKRLRGEDSGGLDYVCLLGLISSPEHDVVRSALEKEMTDPDHPISETFIWAVTTVNTEPSDERWRAAQKNAIEELIAALPAKRGKALTVSLSTAV